MEQLLGRIPEGPFLFPLVYSQGSWPKMVKLWGQWCRGGGNHLTSLSCFPVSGLLENVFLIYHVHPSAALCQVPACSHLLLPPPPQGCGGPFGLCSGLSETGTGRQGGCFGRDEVSAIDFDVILREKNQPKSQDQINGHLIYWLKSEQLAESGQWVLGHDANFQGPGRCLLDLTHML